MHLLSTAILLASINAADSKLPFGLRGSAESPIPTHSQGELMEDFELFDEDVVSADVASDVTIDTDQFGDIIDNRERLIAKDPLISQERLVNRKYEKKPLISQEPLISVEEAKVELDTILAAAGLSADKPVLGGLQGRKLNEPDDWMGALMEVREDAPARKEDVPETFQDVLSHKPLISFWPSVTEKLSIDPMILQEDAADSVEEVQAFQETNESDDALMGDANADETVQHRDAQGFLSDVLKGPGLPFAPPMPGFPFAPGMPKGPPALPFPPLPLLPGGPVAKKPNLIDMAPLLVNPLVVELLKVLLAKVLGRRRLEAGADSDHALKKLIASLREAVEATIQDVSPMEPRRLEGKRVREVLVERVGQALAELKM
ncbi:MAG: hypothetical protein KVP17_004937 [Porospora cf. gigantea B]|uniref:uncharacterized protein n=1 Tax=Porospora cf. gigantea B TaxID=2853592 RepID=UPI0035719C96|nr:MAG: hypothetical protein KVP17_004937 [Porospora cf. gigantea B]